MVKEIICQIRLDIYSFRPVTVQKSIISLRSISWHLKKGRFGMVMWSFTRIPFPNLGRLHRPITCTRTGARKNKERVLIYFMMNVYDNKRRNHIFESYHWNGSCFSKIKVKCAQCDWPGNTMQCHLQCSKVSVPNKSQILKILWYTCQMCLRCLFGYKMVLEHQHPHDLLKAYHHSSLLGNDNLFS